MTAGLRLILTLHNHQPIGNFDGVCEAAWRDSYQPFLKVLHEFPSISVVLHNSGSLLEWLEQHHPEYITELQGLVARGQVEILGGPFYEPILSAIPRHDRLGQILLYKQHLERTFATRVRGMWLPERVWEQSFASDLAEAGVEYTLLDDHHFRQSGLTDERLFGYYLTEDNGKLLKVFAGSERMRYLMPYADPHEIIAHLRGIAEQRPGAVVVFGDDGEKFGVWPGSQSHVYGDSQWLRRFFAALSAEQSWLKTTTMAETVDHVPAWGRHYIGDSSYREMTEWALPSERQVELRDVAQRLEHHPDWSRLRHSVRAGFWRNFLAKYPEANEMYCRMLQISRRLEVLTEEARWAASPMLAAARRALYRAQCNCSYWHGAFGGLYLPHLRNAVYSQLIHADTLIEQATGTRGRWVRLETDDYNLDARKEVCLSSDRLAAYVSPSRGGHIYELDVRAIRHNLAATLNRRPEAYHERIRQSRGTAVKEGTGGGVSANGEVRFKQAGLDEKLQYDRWPRKLFVDHFLQPRLTLDQFQQGQGQLSDFPEGVYQTMLRRRADAVEVRMLRTGSIGPFQVTLTKTIGLRNDQGGVLTATYTLENLPAGLPIHFAVELNLAGLAAGAHDRYYYDEQGRQLGRLETRHDLPRAQRVGVVDEWLGLDVSLESTTPAGFWICPIQTVSQSESGFELVHQSCSVTPHWEISAPDDGRWTTTLTLAIDTSAAQARSLATHAPLRAIPRPATLGTAGR